MLALYGVAVFVGAALVFLVQPMVAKMLLPLFGGSPNVWNTSMLFFQAALLVGYGYAHFSTRWLGLRRHPLVHIGVLALPLLVLPIALPSFAVPPAGAAPAPWLLLVLLVAVGAPYAAVTTASPVLQRWFANTDHPDAADPYLLYALGNAGSLLGLLAYPFLVEPNLSLAGQSTMWAAGYLAFIVLVAACAIAMRRRAVADTGIAEAARATARTTADAAGPARNAPPAAGRAVTIRRRAWWVLLAFVPSSLMLGVTTYLSTDIAAMPLLWVLPLSLYLLTFVIAFGRRGADVPRLAGKCLPVLVLASAVIMLKLIAVPIWFAIPVHLATFFAVALLAHGRLAVDRPAPARLTEFFLLVSVGGVLGGIFNALIAPQIFDTVLEYPLVMVLALLLRPRTPAPEAEADPAPRPDGAPDATGSARNAPVRLAWRLRNAWLLDLVVPLALYLAVLTSLVSVQSLIGTGVPGVGVFVLGGGALSTLLFVRRPVRFAGGVAAMLAIATLVGSPAIHTERTFFGIHRVLVDEEGRHLLAHGTTVHGAQYPEGPQRTEPLAYYHRSGPLGQLLTTLERTGGPRDWAVVGLGSGALAAYGLPGQQLTFFEIDPAVERLARDPAYFSYLADSRAKVDVVVADGRLGIAAVAPESYDLLIIDAFSSDAPPAHLMTREAMEVYLSRLRPGGILAFHISNRYLDLEAAVAGTARSLGLAGLVQLDTDLAGYPAGDKLATDVVLLARDPAPLAALASDPRWEPLASRNGPVWSDDFSDILSIVRWH